MKAVLLTFALAGFFGAGSLNGPTAKHTTAAPKIVKTRATQGKCVTCPNKPCKTHTEPAKTCPPCPFCP